MTRSVGLPKNLLILGIILPLALILGVMLADPLDRSTIYFAGLVVMVLMTPMLLKWHHPMLICSLNLGMIVFFLPGQPEIWMCMAGISVVFTVLSCLLDREKKFIHVPAVTWTLLIFLLVVLITAKATGGMGVRALGGTSYGGKKYYYILFAILAYFALSGQAIPKERIQLYVSLYLLSGVALAFSNFIYLAGPNFYWLYLFFPIDYAVSQATEDVHATVQFNRLSGLGFAGVLAISFMLMRYGLRGLMDVKKPWRLVLCLVIGGISLLGGFRSVLALLGLLFIVYYFLEGLIRSRLTVGLLILVVSLGVFVAAFAKYMPMSVQRSVSFLPVEVHPMARADAEASTEWRLKMWSVLMPEIPKHLWLGKGYTASPTDFYLAQESIKRGLAENIEIALIAGDYHSGPLSILLPFGLWGALAVLAFFIAGLKVLIHNYRHGDPEYANINLFLLALFATRFIFFFVAFGAINSDLVLFCGLLGLSVSINRGLAPKREEQPERSTPALARLPRPGAA